MRSRPDSADGLLSPSRSSSRNGEKDWENASTTSSVTSNTEYTGMSSKKKILYHFHANEHKYAKSLNYNQWFQMSFGFNPLNALSPLDVCGFLGS